MTLWSQLWSKGRTRCTPPTPANTVYNQNPSLCRALHKTGLAPRFPLPLLQAIQLDLISFFPTCYGLECDRLWLIYFFRGGSLCSSVPSFTFASILAVLSAAPLESYCLVWSHQTCQDSVLPTEKVVCISVADPCKPHLISYGFFLQSPTHLVRLLFSDIRVACLHPSSVPVFFSV